MKLRVISNRNKAFKRLKPKLNIINDVKKHLNGRCSILYSDQYPNGALVSKEALTALQTHLNTMSWFYVDSSRYYSEVEPEQYAVFIGSMDL